MAENPYLSLIQEEQTAEQQETTNPYLGLVQGVEPAPEQTRPEANSFTSVDDAFIDAIVQIESGGNRRAVSAVGAQGLAQIMPDTARDPGFGVDPVTDPFDEGQSRRFVQQYMGAMLDKYGNVDDALRAYNWGPSNVDQWIAGGRRDPVPPETRNYVDRFRSIIDPDAPDTATMQNFERPADQNRKEEKTAGRLGVPPEVISRDVNAADRQMRALDARDQFQSAGPATQEFLQRNPRTANDDISGLAEVEATWLGDVARGIAARGTNLAGGLLRSMETITQGQSLFQIDTGEDAAVRRETIEGLEGVQAEGKTLTSWEQVKETPLRSVVPFFIEQGLISTPDMLAVMISLPAYVLARTGEIGQKRAENDARDQATVGDLIAVAPVAVASAMLERLGARGILGLDDVLTEVGTRAIAIATAKAAVKEGGTEFLQESLESVAETTGTVQGFDLADTLERGLAGAVAGTGFGATVRGVTATVESTVKAKQARANVNRRLQTAKAVQKTVLAEDAPDMSIEHTTDVMGDEGRVAISTDQLTPELAEQIGVSPEDYDIALAIGGEVNLDPEQHAAIMLMPEYEQLNNHLRANPDGMTLSEAEQFEETGQAEEIGRLVAEDFDSIVAEELPQAADVKGLNENVRIIPETIEQGAEPTNFDVIVQMPGEIPRLVSAHPTLEEAVKAAGGDVAALEQQLNPRQSQAVQNSVDIAAEQVGYEALFATAEDAGMTPSQFRNYLVASERARSETIKRQQRKVLKQEKDRNSAEQEKERERLREQIGESTRQEPVYAALGAIGPERIDRSALIDILPGGATQLAELPKVNGQNIYTSGKEPGIHPAILAERFGFDGVDIMLFQMMDRPPVEAAIEAAVNQEMKKRHGELLRQGEAINAALESLHNDNAAQLIAVEINQLREAKVQGRVKPALVREAARQLLGRTRLTDIKPAKFLAAERRWAREASKRLRAGNRAGAADAKFRQLIQFQMAREAFQKEQSIKVQRKFMGKFQVPGKKFRRIDARYVDLIKAVLQNTNMAERRRGFDKDINKMATDLQTATGAILKIPPNVQNADGKISSHDMTLDTFESIYETVKNIEAQGRKLRKYKTALGQQSFADLKEELLARTAGKAELKRVRRQRQDQNPRRLDKVSSFIAGLSAGISKVEFLVEELDGGSVGPWHQAIFQRIADAQAAQVDMEKTIMRPLIEGLGNLPKATRKALQKEIYLPSLDRRMKRRDLLMLALNAGNESNLDKVIRGSESDNKAKAWTRDGVLAAVDTLTKEEGDWVQSVWDAFEGLRPQVENIFREEFGIAPERVVNSPILLGGKLRDGGYFPMMYDPRRAATEIAGPAPKTALEAMRSREVQASVFSGMTKERTGFAAPVLLNMEQMPTAFQRTIHYITHYEAVRDTTRLIHDDAIRTEIRNKLGPEFYEEFENWLKAVATNGTNERDIKTWGPTLEFFRRSTTAAVMGFSYTTGVAQTFGFTTSVAVLGQRADGKFSNREGLKWIRVGMTKYIQNPVAATREAFSRSKELRNRMSSFDREVADVMNRVGGKGKLLEREQRLALQMIGGIQLYTVDMPTWLGAYNQGLSRGMGEDLARNHADSVLRKSQSSGTLKDLSALQRKRGLWRVMTMFSTFLMTLYNLQRQTLRRGIQKPSEAARVVARMAWLVAIPALADGLMRQDIPGEDDDEGFAAWWALRTIGFGLSSIPIAGQAVDSAIQGFDTKLSPIEIIGTKLVNGYQAVSEVISDQELTFKNARILLNSLLFTAGVGGASQLDRALKAIENNDDAEIYDYLIGYNERR